MAAIAVSVVDGNKYFFNYFVAGLKEAADHPQLRQARSVVCYFSQNERTLTHLKTIIMEAELANNRSINAFRFILFFSCLTLLFWLFSQTINVYKSKVVGAIFEILWLPAILSLFSLPVFSFYFWRKDKFKITSKFSYLLIWTLMSILILFILSRY